MKLKYDLHIHTALSPCGADDMTPNNIVNMALMNDLDVIAITDHNSSGNVAAVMEVAKSTGIIVIPGLEVETKEEIHVVCLFSALNDVYNVQKIIDAHLPPRINPIKVFGHQYLFDKNDDIIGEAPQLLSFATDIAIDDLLDIVLAHSGVAIPAHIDRPSYSLVSNLGMVPHDFPIKTLEISRHKPLDTYKNQDTYKNYQLIQNSDAHDLGYIGCCDQYLEVPEKEAKAVIQWLKL